MNEVDKQFGRLGWRLLPGAGGGLRGVLFQVCGPCGARRAQRAVLHQSLPLASMAAAIPGPNLVFTDLPGRRTGPDSPAKGNPCIKATGHLPIE